jgi:glutamyl-tRNA(Gln) amidotransferase subunit D
MLPETALVKLMWCLGQTKDREKVLRLMKMNLAGEHGDRTTYAEALD